MYRFYITETQQEEAEEILTNCNVPYDLDSSDRILLDNDYVDEALEPLNENGIKYEEVG